MPRIIQTSRRRTLSGSGKALLAPAVEQSTPGQAAEPGSAASRKRKQDGRRPSGNASNTTASRGRKRRKTQDELPTDPTSPTLGRSEQTGAREMPAPQSQSVQPTLLAPRGKKRKAEGEPLSPRRATRKGTGTARNPQTLPENGKGQEGQRARRQPQQDEQRAQEAYRDEITNVQDEMELDPFVPDIHDHAATQNLRPPAGGGGGDDPTGQGPGGGAGGGAPGGDEDSSDDDDSPPGSSPPDEEYVPDGVPDREDEDLWDERSTPEEGDRYKGELYDPGFVLCITGDPPEVGHDFCQGLKSGGDPLHQGWEIVKWLATRGNHYELRRGLPFHHDQDNEQGNEAEFRPASVVLNNIARARRARPYCPKRDFARAATSAVTWAYHIDLRRMTLGVYGPPKLRRRDTPLDNFFHESVHVIDGRAPRHIADYTFEELRRFENPAALHQSILHALAAQDVRRYSIPPPDHVWVLYEPVYRDEVHQEPRTPSVSAASTQEDDDDDDYGNGGPGPGLGGGPHSSSSPLSSSGPHTPGSPGRPPTPPMPNGHAQEAPGTPDEFDRSPAPSPEEIPGGPRRTPPPASNDDLTSISGGTPVANEVPVTNGYRAPSPQYPNIWEQVMPLAGEQGAPDVPPQTPIPHPTVDSPSGPAEPRVNGVLRSPIHFQPRPPFHESGSSSTEIAPGTSPPQQPVEYTEPNFSPLGSGPQSPGPQTPGNQPGSGYDIPDDWSPGDPTPPHLRPPNSSSSPGDYVSDQENVPPPHHPSHAPAQTNSLWASDPRTPSPQPPPRTPSPQLPPRTPSPRPPPHRPSSQPSLEDYVSDDEYDDANFPWPANLPQESPPQPAPPRTPPPGTRQNIESDSRVFNEPESSTPDISREPHGDDDGSPTLGVEAAQQATAGVSQDESPQGSLPSSPPVPRSPSHPHSPPRLPPLLTEPRPTIERPTPAPARQNEQLSFQDPVWNSYRDRSEFSDEESVSPKSSSRPNSRAPSWQSATFAHGDDVRLPPASENPSASPAPNPPGPGRDVDGEDSFIRLPSSDSGSWDATNDPEVVGEPTTQPSALPAVGSSQLVGDVDGQDGFIKLPSSGGSEEWDATLEGIDVGSSPGRIRRELNRPAVNPGTAYGEGGQAAPVDESSSQLQEENSEFHSQYSESQG